MLIYICGMQEFVTIYTIYVCKNSIFYDFEKIKNVLKIINVKEVENIYFVN